MASDLRQPRAAEIGRNRQAWAPAGATHGAGTAGVRAGPALVRRCTTSVMRAAMHRAGAFMPEPPDTTAPRRAAPVECRLLPDRRPPRPPAWN
ncbi:hypothetical protein WJ63_18785 [Burkholderia pyrrocinia]|nr:hypothetical protein WJ63_18785 [Burkholderia pyrrocinia]